MSDYSELNLKAQAAIDAIGTLSRAQRERNFNDACTPQVVQALIAENEALCAKVSNLNVSGFAEAFYTVAEKLGVTGARPVSPMQVFASEVLPALQSAIKDAERLHHATAFVQKLCDAAGKQPSVATGYLHDILSVMADGEQP